MIEIVKDIDDGSVKFTDKNLQKLIKIDHSLFNDFLDIANDSELQKNLAESEEEDQNAEIMKKIHEINQSIEKLTKFTTEIVRVTQSSKTH